MDFLPRSSRKKVMPGAYVHGMSNSAFRLSVRSTLVALAVSLTCVSAFAADVKPPAKDQPAGSVPVDPKQVVCKRVAGASGMLPGAKVCHTRAEWAEIEKQGGDNAAGASDSGHD